MRGEGTSSSDPFPWRRGEQRAGSVLSGAFCGLTKKEDEAGGTRHEAEADAAAEKATVIGFDFAFPSVGHVEKDGAGYRLIPSSWNPTL